VRTISILVDGDYFYVTPNRSSGAPSSWLKYLEKRSITNYDLVWSQEIPKVASSSSGLQSICQDDSAIYTLQQTDTSYTVRKFLKTDGSPSWTLERDLSGTFQSLYPKVLRNLGDYLYMFAECYLADWTQPWYIEKIRKSDHTVVDSYLCEVDIFYTGFDISDQYLYVAFRLSSEETRVHLWCLSQSFTVQWTRQIDLSGIDSFTFETISVSGNYIWVPGEVYTSSPQASKRGLLKCNKSDGSLVEATYGDDTVSYSTTIKGSYATPGGNIFSSGEYRTSVYNEYRKMFLQADKPPWPWSSGDWIIWTEPSGSAWFEGVLVNDYTSSSFFVSGTRMVGGTRYDRLEKRSLLTGEVLWSVEWEGYGF